MPETTRKVRTTSSLRSSYNPVSSSSSSSPSFERLHPKLRQWIWRQGWQKLRDIQERAIPLVLDGEHDVILAAATAGGKTEAAFLPILSALEGEAGGGIRVLCVSPLKALINDQFERLEQMGSELDVAVHRWHGDVGHHHKRKVLKTPSGVLIITPESLEAMLILRGHRVPGLFRVLDYVVVDELHTFLDTERGRQLQSLLHRVELATRRRTPRIALSATLGDMGAAAEFLRPGRGKDVHVLVSAERGQELRLQVRGSRLTPPGVHDEHAGDPVGVSRHLFETLRGGHHLIFANTRSQVEEYADRLRRYCEQARVPQEFWPHHGSLSRDLREHAESALKDHSRPTTLIATTTLELGIDVGAIESVAQIGPPPSVAGLRQRLGRSGRGGEAAILRVYVLEPRVRAETAPTDAIHVQLVRTLAMIQLLLDRWYEPPEVKKLHLSTLVQQTLSLVAQHGGVRAGDAFRALCRSGPFSQVDASRYAELLYCLGDADLLTQTHDGELVLGLEGERLVEHYDFFAAFTSSEEYRLVAQGKELGTLPIANPVTVDSLLIFGGRRWRIVALDDQRKVIDVIPARGGRVPSFVGQGAALVHDQVRRRMVEAYLSEDVPGFLNAGARELLEEGRANFRRFRLDAEPMLSRGSDTWWFLFRGDRILGTLSLAFRNLGLDVEHEGPALRFTDVSPEDLRRLALELASTEGPDPLDLAAAVKNLQSEKHHGFLSRELLLADYVSRALDVRGAWRALRENLDTPHR